MAASTSARFDASGFSQIHMNFMAKEKLCLGKVQGIRAGNIHRVNGIAFRHRFQRGKQMLDRKIIGEVLRPAQGCGNIRRLTCIYRSHGGDLDELAE